jgi:aryl-alcohol dehydrogenase-like predicted oxidoreductase
MRRIQIPGTELSVSPICLGTAEFGASVPEALAHELLDTFVANGGSFIDTALVYSDWIPGTKSRSEKLLGRWLQARGNRQQITLATKGAHPDLASMHVARMSPADIIGDIDQSLSHLQTDTIDLYWLHRDDHNTPVSSIIDTLHAQVEAGKIRYFGCSNWHIDRIAEAQAYAAQRGIQGFVANQPMWSLAQPNINAIPDKTLVALDQAGIAFHQRTGMAVIPYSSQAHGFFTKLEAQGRRGLPASDDLWYYNAANLRRLREIQRLARAHNVTVNTIVLSYLCSQPFVTIPVVGCQRLDHLKASLSALDLTLTSDEIAALESD